ncbi:hypothetical protein PWP93_27070 [Paraburkholderia sp. A1RI-2L]|uniref:hypothetical protein n=1 Tax=Paraburkholderia sp. A1RI-2L TaxID=3028367 RepID=UPI003B807298
MRNIRIIKDGNFTQWFCLVLVVVGLGIMYLTLKFAEPSIWSKGLVLVGFGIAAVGGMASRAALVHIKPFGNNWKKTRKRYEVKNDEQDKS